MVKKICSGIAGVVLSFAFSLSAIAATTSFSTATTVHVTQCGTLSQSNVTYILDNDVSSIGTCFTVPGHDIIFDLNGHTILYDNYANTGLPNPGFENGNGTIPSDWDLSQMPSAYRRSNSVVNVYGDWHLFLGSNPNSGDRIISPWAYLPPNQTATAYLTQAEPNWAYAQPRPIWNVTVEFEDGTVVSSVTSPDGSGLMMGGVPSGTTFTTKAKEGKYRAILTLVNNQGYTSNTMSKGALLDNFDLRPAGNYGIYFSGYNTNKNYIVKNGRIVQGPGQSVRGHGIMANNGVINFEVANIYFDNGGAEASALSTNYSSNVYFHDNTINNKNPLKWNRMQLSAAVTISNNSSSSTDSVIIKGNNFLDCGEGWGCIYLGGSGEIANNIIRSRSVTTNHLASLGGNYIHDNIVESSPGQGISGGPGNTGSGEIFNNKITIYKQAPNFEYGFYEVDGIMLKDYAGGTCKNMKIHNNDVTIYGDYDAKFEGMLSATSRIYSVGISTMCTGGGLSIYNNHITTKSFKEKAIPAGLDPGASPYETIVAGNTIESNIANLMIGGYASQGYAASMNNKYIGNTFIKLPDAGANYHFYASSHGGATGDDKMHFVDNQLTGGASYKDTLNRWVTVNFWVDWYLNVLVKDQNGVPLPGATVVVKDASSTVVFSGSTDQAGLINKIVLGQYKRAGAEVKTTYLNTTPHTVTITPLGGDAFVTPVTMDSSKMLTYQVGQTPVIVSVAPFTGPFQPADFPPNIIRTAPNGVLAYNQNDITFALVTSKNAMCRFSGAANTPYDLMTSMQTTGGTDHSHHLGILPIDRKYNYYFKCKDENGAITMQDAIATFVIRPTPGDSSVIPAAITSQTTDTLLHMKMESVNEVNNPTVATQKMSPSAIRTSANGQIVFEQGVDGNAARFVINGSTLNQSSSIDIAHDNLDYSDINDDGGKIEFWMKFNQDPHIPRAETFFLNSDIYPGTLVGEILGSDPYLMFEWYTNRVYTANRFLVYSGGWDKWQNWKQNEWHKITIVWKKNGPSEGKAEMHLFIDDTQQGCPANNCNKYNGYLPRVDQWTRAIVGNFGDKGNGAVFATGNSAALDWSIDELKSFDRVMTMPALSSSTMQTGVGTMNAQLGNATTSNSGGSTTQTGTSFAITTISVTNVTPVAATIKFKTGSAAKVSLDYGLTTSYGKKISNLNSNGIDVSSVDLSALTPSSAYHYRITATASSGTVTSGDYIFTTKTIPQTVAPGSGGGAFESRQGDGVSNTAARSDLPRSNGQSSPITIDKPVQTTNKRADSEPVKQQQDNAADDGSPMDVAVLNIRYGATSPEFKKVQQLLKEEKLIPSSVKITGYYGDYTKNAIVKFQKKYGITEGGATSGEVLGPKTIKKMNDILSKKGQSLNATASDVTKEQQRVEAIRKLIVALQQQVLELLRQLHAMQQLNGATQ